MPDKQRFGSGDQHAERPPEELSPEKLAKEVNYGDGTRGADAEHMGAQGSVDNGPMPVVPDRDNEALVTPNRDLEPTPRPGSVPPEEGEPHTDDKVA